MDPVGKQAQLLKDVASHVACLGKEGLRPRVAKVLRGTFAETQLELEREQQLLRTIVQVSLEIAPFGVADFDDATSRRT